MDKIFPLSSKRRFQRTLETGKHQLTLNTSTDAYNSQSAEEYVPGYYNLSKAPVFAADVFLLITSCLCPSMLGVTETIVRERPVNPDPEGGKQTRLEKD